MRNIWLKTQLGIFWETSELDHTWKYRSNVWVLNSVMKWPTFMIQSLLLIYGNRECYIQVYEYTHLYHLHKCAHDWMCVLSEWLILSMAECLHVAVYLFFFLRHQPEAMCWLPWVRLQPSFCKHRHWLNPISFKLCFPLLLMTLAMVKVTFLSDVKYCTYLFLLTFTNTNTLWASVCH